MTKVSALLIAVVYASSAHAEPPGSCADVCRHVTQCGLLTFAVCRDHCTDRTAADRAENAKQARSSCNDLAAQMPPHQWVCSAEGASAAQYFEGADWTPDTIFMTGSAKTRAEAGFNAVRDCRYLMSMGLTLGRSATSWSVDHTRVTSECHVTTCYPPR